MRVSRDYVGRRCGAPNSVLEDIAVAEKELARVAVLGQAAGLARAVAAFRGRAGDDQRGNVRDAGDLQRRVVAGDRGGRAA